MSVFVDDAKNPFGRMKMCHMWADTREELLEMADKIGVARKWIQMPPKASWVHFDICISKRAIAIRCGAIQTDRYGPTEFTTRDLISRLSALDTAHAPEVMKRIENLQKRLETIETLREKKAQLNPEASEHQQSLGL